MYAVAKTVSLKRAIAIVAAAAMLVVFTPQLVGAADEGTKGGQCKTGKSCDAGLTCNSLNVCVEGAKSKGNDTFGLGKVNDGLDDSLGSTNLQETIGNIINVALSLLGVVAVVIILIGGFKWMTAGGSEEKVAEARKQIFQGIIGLGIILSAWAITIFVLNSLSTATGSGNTGEFKTS
jgi:hypothetical protein